MRVSLLVCVIAASLSACGGAPEPPAASEPVPAATIASQPADAWSQEALEVQPEMALLQQQTPADTGYMPGTTAWTPLPTEVETAAASTPGSLLMGVISSQQWADVLGDAVWEQTTRVLIDDSGVATGVVLQWGLMDDAVAGRDFRVSMRRAGDMWSVTGVERRFHCRRGVSAGGQCR